MKNYKLHFICFYSSILTIILSLTFQSCSNINMFAPQDDVKLGEEVSRQIDNDPKEYPILNNSEIRNYVQGVVNEIIRSPEIQYRGQFPYTVKIINDDKTVNAFCTPGGYIYVYTGLLRFVDNEATLAGVIGHEIAHAERRHSTSRMTKAMGAQLLLDIIVGKNPSKTAQLAENLFTGLGFLKNSRDDELEADDYSFKYLRSTQWYPGAIKMFFDKILSTSAQKGGELERLLSTHPLPQDRIDATNKRLKAADIPPPNENNLFTRKYQKLKSRV